MLRLYNRERGSKALRSAIWPTAFAAAIGVCIAMSSPAERSQAAVGPSANLSGAVNDFGFRLLRTLITDNGQNVIVSPLSVWLALAMTSNGAAGDTRTAIAKTIGVQSLDERDFNRAGHELLVTLQKADPAVTMEIANALWTQSGFPINPDFLNASREFYDAVSEGLDFEGKPDEAVAAINAWVNKNTHGRIPTIISRTERSTRLILTDAVYFKGRWQSPFVRKATRPRTFHLDPDRSVQAMMMTKGGEFPYLENPDFQAIRIAYGNNRFAMDIFLPRKLTGLADFAAMLDAQHWSQWTGARASRKGTIVMPRFESSYSKRLNDALATTRMAIAFDAGKADFSRIHPPPPPLLVNDVEHKTWVKVDEEGTEAAAVTSVGVATAMRMHTGPPPFQMVVDHPFFFAITEQRSGAILFAGIVTDPASR